ncbi:DUF4127 family protein [bacterium]|nr:DUF4127 family protein [bacterium]
MRRIAIIPIDNRPVTYLLPKQIGEIDKNTEILLPPRELMGGLRTQADIYAILDWLEALENVEILIISLDTIAYGGLIQSRYCNNTTKQIMTRLKKLKNIIAEKNLRVYAMSSIMRISNNNVNEEEKPYWAMFGRRIFEYSFACHKAEETGLKEDYKRIKTAKKEIPEEILEDYLETRKRNFEINLEYLDWVKEGIIHTLVYSKDDCAQYGLNVQEARKLEDLTHDNKEIFVKTGADEIPLALLCRAMNSTRKQKIKVLPVFTCIEGTGEISNYEDITVFQSVKGQIELAGGFMIQDRISLSSIKNMNVEEKYGADLVLVVNNFEGKQGELVLGTEADKAGEAFTMPPLPFFVADIKNANGGDNYFVESLLKYLPSEKFFGYAGWNTTGNSLGSAISCAFIKFNSERVNREMFNQLQATRFLDDWSYQANVRWELKEENKSLDLEVLKNKMGTYEEKIKRLFRIRDDIKYTLPWHRSFEVEVEFDKLG